MSRRGDSGEQLDYDLICSTYCVVRYFFKDINSSIVDKAVRDIYTCSVALIWTLGEYATPNPTLHYSLAHRTQDSTLTGYPIL